MKTFKDEALPLAIGVGVGILCTVHGYTPWETLAFVTALYFTWRFILWGVK